MSHRVYIDSLSGIVETPFMACPSCLSYESDEMWVKVVMRRESGFASRRTIVRHLVVIEGHKEPVVHFIICYHDLRKRGLRCCFVGLDSTLHNKPLSLEEFIAKERSIDKLDRSGDCLPQTAGYMLVLQKAISDEAQSTAV